MKFSGSQHDSDPVDDNRSSLLVFGTLPTSLELLSYTTIGVANRGFYFWTNRMIQTIRQRYGYGRLLIDANGNTEPVRGRHLPKKKGTKRKQASMSNPNQRQSRRRRRSTASHNGNENYDFENNNNNNNDDTNKPISSDQVQLTDEELWWVNAEIPPVSKQSTKKHVTYHWAKLLHNVWVNHNFTTPVQRLYGNFGNQYDDSDNDNNNNNNDNNNNNNNNNDNNDNLNNRLLNDTQEIEESGGMEYVVDTSTIFETEMKWIDNHDENEPYEPPSDWLDENSMCYLYV